MTIKRLGINGEGIGYFKRLAILLLMHFQKVVEVKITKTTEKYAYGIVNSKDFLKANYTLVLIMENVVVVNYNI